jgi:hypothetical protein
MAGFKAHFFTAAVAGGTVATALLSEEYLPKTACCYVLLLLFWEGYCRI